MSNNNKSHGIVKEIMEITRTNEGKNCKMKI